MKPDHPGNGHGQGQGQGHGPGDHGPQGHGGGGDDGGGGDRFAIAAGVLPFLAAAGKTPADAASQSLAYADALIAAVAPAPAPSQGGDS